MNKKYSNAFTIVEIMTTIVLIAVVSATLGVAFRVVSPRQLESEIQKLVNDLSWGRAMARSTHFDYLFDFDVDGDTVPNPEYTIYRVDTVPPIDPPVIVGRRRLDIDDIAIFHGPLGPATPITEFDFNHTSGGLIDNIDPLTISIFRQDQQADVTINNLTGHIAWELL